MMRSTYHKAGSMRNVVTRRALGDIVCDTDGQNCYDNGISSGTNPTADLPVVSPVFSATIPTSGITNTAPGPNYGSLAPIANTPAPSTGPGFFQTLLNDAAGIAAPLIKSATSQSPYFITSPTGQSVLYNPNTGTVGATSALGLSSSAISPTVLMAGLGVLAVLMLAGKK